VDLHTATVVVNETEFAELIHEEVDAAASGGDHFGESFLQNVGDDGAGTAFSTVLREKEKRAGEAFFRGIEELVDEIGLDPEVTFRHVGDELFGKFLFFRVEETKKGGHRVGAPASFTAFLWN
jgi:hypothetical protein